MIPREPTQEMLAAAQQALPSGSEALANAYRTRIWQAMYDAAPKPEAATAATPCCGEWFTCDKPCSPRADRWKDAWRTAIDEAQPLDLSAPAPAAPKHKRCEHDRWPGDDCDICPAPAAPDDWDRQGGWRRIVPDAAPAAPTPDAPAPDCDCGTPERCPASAECVSLPDAAPAPDADGLVERLQWASRGQSHSMSHKEAQDCCREAAPVLAAQAAQIAELTRERDARESELYRKLKQIIDLTKDAKRAEAELHQRTCERDEARACITVSAARIAELTRRLEAAERDAARMRPLFNKACAIVDAWDGTIPHPLAKLRDSAREGAP